MAKGKTSKDDMPMKGGHMMPEHHKGMGGKMPMREKETPMKHGKGMPMKGGKK